MEVNMENRISNLEFIFSENFPTKQMIARIKFTLDKIININFMYIVRDEKGFAFVIPNAEIGNTNKEENIYEFKDEFRISLYTYLFYEYNKLLYEDNTTGIS